MDVNTYRRKRAEAQAAEPAYRQICWTCRQPDFSCYCEWLKPFDPKIQFVILIHPLEAFRRIATGRLSHLSLNHSRLIMGHRFSECGELNELLADPARNCMMLYPGAKAIDLTILPLEKRKGLIPPQKIPTIIVIDGTWSTARQMVNQSPNLKDLPRICFTPERPSNFRIRKQPRPECFSTIEAVHKAIDLLGPACGFDLSTRTHDVLLEVFEKLVNRQLDLAFGTHARVVRPLPVIR